jgi:AmiR/NasT family two-component response regulator
LTESLRASEGSLHELVDRLRIHNAQLERALESRIVIEQAKGVLAERYALSVDDAFDLLRRSARSNRVSIHDLAGRVVTERSSPLEVALTLAKAVSARR